jgi:hypothetical protein
LSYEWIEQRICYAVSKKRTNTYDGLGRQKMGVGEIVTSRFPQKEVYKCLENKR